MAKAIENIALKEGHTISKIILRGELGSLEKKDGQVAIEFTNPESAFENIKHCLTSGIPVVSGTTGWINRKAEIDELCKLVNGSFFYASNFSIGVNLFFKINRFVADLLKNQNYDVSIMEKHHSEKKDAPSGTAITIANEIIRRNDKYDNWSLDQNENRNLHIESIREGNVPGTHEINYGSDIDKITLRHEAYSREGFALGTVKVAEWLEGKKGVFGMDDFLKI